MDEKDTIKRPLWLKAGAPTIFLAAILQIVAKWIAHNRFPDWRWSARLEMCQWRRETLDKESIWDEARSTSLSRW